MKGKLKLLLIFFLASIAVIGYFSYGVIKERYWQKDSNVAETEEESDSEDSDQEYSDDSFETETAEEANESLASNVTGFLEISKNDCENECESFQNDTSRLAYCQNICGLNEDENITGECDKKSGLEKDYCLKDLAIKEQDLEKCDLVQDGKVKKTCQNRILEDFVDSQEGELE